MDAAARGTRGGEQPRRSGGAEERPQGRDDATSEEASREPQKNRRRSRTAGGLEAAPIEAIAELSSEQRGRDEGRKRQRGRRSGVVASRERMAQQDECSAARRSKNERAA